MSLVDELRDILYYPITNLEEIMIVMQSPILCSYVESVYSEIAEKGYCIRSITLKVDEE